MAVAEGLAQARLGWTPAGVQDNCCPYSLLGTERSGCPLPACLSSSVSPPFHLVRKQACPDTTSVSRSVLCLEQGWAGGSGQGLWDLLDPLTSHKGSRLMVVVARAFQPPLQWPHVRSVRPDQGGGEQVASDSSQLPHVLSAGSLAITSLP